MNWLRVWHVLKLFLATSSRAATVGHTNSNMGPLKWMSPEAILRQEYSEKSDAFSFGVCLWEMLFRQSPYPGFHDLQAALLVANDPSFRPPIPEACPGPIKQLMLDCWVPQPELRPSFREILSRLQRFLNTAPRLSPQAYSQLIDDAHALCQAMAAKYAASASVTGAPPAGDLLLSTKPDGSNGSSREEEGKHGGPTATSTAIPASPAFPYDTLDP